MRASPRDRLHGYTLPDLEHHPRLGTVRRRPRRPSGATRAHRGRHRRGRRHELFHAPYPRRSIQGGDAARPEALRARSLHLATRGNAMHLGLDEEIGAIEPGRWRTWWCSTRRLRRCCARGRRCRRTSKTPSSPWRSSATTARYGRPTSPDDGCGTVLRAHDDRRTTGAGRSGHRRIGVALRPHGSEAENDAVGGKSGVEQQVVPERRFAQGVVPRQAPDGAVHAGTAG